MKIYFINGNNNESYSKFFKQYITGGFYWSKIKDKITYRIVIIRQKTLYLTCKVFLHEYLHYINLVFSKDNTKFNNIIEKYI